MSKVSGKDEFSCGATTCSETLAMDVRKTESNTLHGSAVVLFSNNFQQES